MFILRVTFNELKMSKSQPDATSFILIQLLRLDTQKMRISKENIVQWLDLVNSYELISY
jgi:hypothetical protein